MCTTLFEGCPGARIKSCMPVAGLCQKCMLQLLARLTPEAQAQFMREVNGQQPPFHVSLAEAVAGGPGKLVLELRSRKSEGKYLSPRDSIDRLTQDVIHAGYHPHALGSSGVRHPHLLSRKYPEDARRILPDARFKRSRRTGRAAARACGRMRRSLPA